MLGRLVGGFAVGLNSALVPLYINEIAPSEISGNMGAMNQTFVNVGILTSFLLAFNLPSKADMLANPSGSNWWRFIFGFPIITCVGRILLLLTVINYDTPAYLMKIGKEE